MLRLTFPYLALLAKVNTTGVYGSASHWLGQFQRNFTAFDTCAESFLMREVGELWWVRDSEVMQYLVTLTHPNILTLCLSGSAPMCEILQLLTFVRKLPEQEG